MTTAVGARLHERDVENALTPCRQKYIVEAARCYGTARRRRSGLNVELGKPIHHALLRVSAQICQPVTPIG